MKKSHNPSSILQSLIALACVGLFVWAVFFATLNNVAQGSGTASMTGYLWSDTAGWISLNCSDLGTCGTSNYGLSIATDGTLSGYAWSENIGWVSANSADLAGCPTGPCTATISGSALSGWLRAIAGNTSQSGAWDGFISLSGVGYGPTLASGAFSGYAWGSEVVGWTDFSQARTTWSPCIASYLCTDGTHYQEQCSGTITACTGINICSGGACVPPPAPSFAPGGTLVASPTLVHAGQNSQISWNIQDATTCSVTGNGNSWSGVASSVGGNTTNPIANSVTYTLTCSGVGGTFGATVDVTVAPEWREI